MRWGAAERSRLVCGLSQGEIFACVLIIGAVIWYASHSIVAAIGHMRQVEVLNLATRGKIYWAEHWANAGRGASALPFIEEHLRGSSTLALPSATGDGSFSYQMTAGPVGTIGGVITLRPLVAVDPEVTNLRWICGTRPVPEGFIAVGANHTSLEPEQLMSTCRGHL